MLGEDTTRTQGKGQTQEVTQSKKTEGTIFGVAGGMGIMGDAMHQLQAEREREAEENQK